MIDEKNDARLVIERRLEEAADAALSDADIILDRENRYPTISEMAKAVYEKRGDLMEDAKESVLFDRLCWVIKRRKAARFARLTRQLDLPGLELPRTVFMKNGSRPRLEHCTAREFDEAIKVLEGQSRERQNPKLGRLKIAREIMEEYRMQTRDITWGEVKRKEAEKRDFERLDVA
jgi:hypothetical protein